MSKVASIALLAALAASASSQTYYSQPYSLQQRSATVALSTTSSLGNRYLRLTAEHQANIPAAMVNWFNVAYYPYWSMSNATAATPNFLAGDFYVANPLGVKIETVNASFSGRARFRFQGGWIPPMDSIPENPVKLYPYNGKDYWMVVVKQDTNGQYSMYWSPYGDGASPSYYSLGPGGFDSAFSNKQSAPYFNKFLDFDLFKDITPYNTQIDMYWILFCSWTQTNQYIGVTIKDAMKVTTYVSPYPYNGI